MNVRFLTGYLTADAVTAWAPATASVAAAPRLLFDVVIKDSAGVEFPEKCLIDDADLLGQCRPLLTAGRMVIVQGEQAAFRWVDDHGVFKGYRRQVRCWKVEFPNRSAAPKPKEEPKNG